MNFYCIGIMKGKQYIQDLKNNLGSVKEEISKAKEQSGKQSNRRRSQVPTKENMRMRQLINNPFPRYVLKDHATMKAFEDFSPHAFMSSVETAAKRNLVDFDSKQNYQAQKRTLESKSNFVKV